MTGIAGLRQEPRYAWHDGLGDFEEALISLCIPLV